MAHLNIPNTMEIHRKGTISRSRCRRKYDLKQCSSGKFKLAQPYTNLIEFSSVKLTDLMMIIS